MKTPSQHLEFGKLADLAENRLNENETSLSQSHLAGCIQCTKRFQDIARTIQLMLSDDSKDAPRDALLYAINIFDRRRASVGETLRRVIASLTFDSFTSAPAFGVRSGQSPTRQLLYSTAEGDIDIRVTRQNNDWIIAGQLLRENCVGGRAEIEGEAGTTSSDLNSQCEFNLRALPDGVYTLRLQLPDIELEIPHLELKDQ